MNAKSPRLTEKQRAIFNWMVDFTVEHFYQPSIREVMDRFGLRSPNAVKSHFKGLERKGLITVVHYQSRGLVFHRRTPIAEGETL